MARSLTVLTLGTFDLLHAGHVSLLRDCRDLAGEGEVIVGLNTDAFVERYKGRAPIVEYADRAACLSAVRYVDAVLPNDQTDGSALDVIRAADPDVIAIGWDWRERDYLGQLGISNADVTGIRIVYLALIDRDRRASSEIKARIRSAA